MENDDRAEHVARLNDVFRRTFVGGKVVMTAGVATLPQEMRARILTAVRQFSAFGDANDPHGEHDFGAFDIGGETYFWKIDYYDLALEYGSENPADSSVTTRVLTIMRASEY